MYRRAHMKQSPTLIVVPTENKSMQQQRLERSKFLWKEIFQKVSFSPLVILRGSTLQMALLLLLKFYIHTPFSVSQNTLIFHRKLLHTPHLKLMPKFSSACCIFDLVCLYFRVKHLLSTSVNRTQVACQKSSKQSRFGSTGKKEKTFIIAR